VLPALPALMPPRSIRSALASSRIIAAAVTLARVATNEIWFPDRSHGRRRRARSAEHAGEARCRTTRGSAASSA
jgi:hypothetical protein